MNRWWKLAQRGLAALLPPASCLLCEAPAGAIPNLCDACARELPRPAVPCRGCAVPLPAPGLCRECLQRAPPFRRTRAALLYAPPVTALVQRMKYGPSLPAAAALAALLAEAAAASRTAPPEGLVPVPLHPRRLRERGFNQALELARGVGRRLELPVLAGAARRCRATPSQSGLGGRGARRRNVRGAFAAGRGLGGQRHVAIVDDVMTAIIP